jgi:hypothetical protein
MLPRPDMSDEKSEPRIAGRRLRRLGRQAWRDEARREGRSPAFARSMSLVAMACLTPSSSHSPIRRVMQTISKGSGSLPVFHPVFD